MLEELAQLLGRSCHIATDVATYVADLSHSEWRRRLCRPEAPAGQWLLCLNEALESTVEITLNLFLPTDHGRLWSSGSLTPHKHNRDFVTRILFGSYGHWLYRSASPHLVIECTRAMFPGDVYGLSRDRIHLITPVAIPTATLAIRLPGEASGTERNGAALTFNEVDLVRSEILRGLEDAKNSPGRVTSIWT